MRPAYLFPAIAAAGAVIVAGIALAHGAPVSPLVAAYIVGVGLTIFASIIVNSCNTALYGRKTWDESEHSDFVEKPATYRQPESPWGDVQRGGYHCADMRRGRLRRHAETQVTFPAGDAA